MVKNKSNSQEIAVVMERLMTKVKSKSATGQGSGEMVIRWRTWDNSTANYGATWVPSATKATDDAKIAGWQNKVDGEWRSPVVELSGRGTEAIYREIYAAWLANPTTAALSAKCEAVLQAAAAKRAEAWKAARAAEEAAKTPEDREQEKLEEAELYTDEWEDPAGAKAAKEALFAFYKRTGRKPALESVLLY